MTADIVSFAAASGTIALLMPGQDWQEIPVVPGHTLVSQICDCVGGDAALVNEILWTLGGAASPARSFAIFVFRDAHVLDLPLNVIVPCQFVVNAFGASRLQGPIAVIREEFAADGSSQLRPLRRGDLTLVRDLPLWHRPKDDEPSVSYSLSPITR